MNALAMGTTGVLLLTVLCDWFERWREKHTEVIERFGIAPRAKRWSFVRIYDHGHLWVEAFYFRLSSYAWEHRIEADDYGWMERVVTWTSHDGWHVMLWRPRADE